MFGQQGIGLKINIIANANDAHSKLNKISKKFVKMNKAVNKSKRVYKDFGRAAKRALYSLDRQLERTDKNVSNTAIRISNKLGFLAFQWNFMANAATQALRTVVQGLQEIVTTGAQLDHERIRAIAYASSLDQLSKSGEGLAQITREVTQTIYELGAGGSAFNIEEVAKQYSQLLKAVPDKDIATRMLEPLTKIKLLEPEVDSERLATGFVTLLNISGVDGTLENINSMFDFTASLVDNTTLRFNDAIGSLSRLMPLVKQFGWEMTDAGAMIVLSADYLGRNKSSGRAGSSAGTWAAAALSEIANLTNPDTSAGKNAIKLGLEIYENGSIVSFPNLIQRLIDFSNQFETQQEQIIAFNKLGISGNGLNYILQIKELGPAWAINMKEILRTQDALNGRWKVLQGTADTSLKRIKAGVDGLKSSFVGGLSPALYAFAQGMHELTSSEEARSTIASLAFEMSKTLVPAISIGLRAIKNLLTFLVSNKEIIRHFARMVILAVGAIALFAGLTTAMFMLFVLGSSALAAAGQFGILVTMMRSLLLRTLIMVVGLVALFAGVVLVAWGLLELSKVINPDKDGSALKAILALGAGMGIFGLVGLSQIGNITRLGSAIKALGVTMLATSGASRLMGTSNAFPTFINRPPPMNPAFPLFYQKAGKKSALSFMQPFTRIMGGSPIVMAVAAAAIIAIALTIGPALMKQFSFIKQQAQAMGLKSSWDIVGRDWELGWARILSNPLTMIDSLKRSLGDFGTYLAGWGKEIGNLLGGVGMLIADPLNWEIHTETISKAASAMKSMYDNAITGGYEKEVLMKQIDEYINAQKERGLEGQAVINRGSEGDFDKYIQDRIDIGVQDGIWDEGLIESIFKASIPKPIYASTNVAPDGTVPDLTNGWSNNWNVGNSNLGHDRYKPPVDGYRNFDLNNIGNTNTGSIIGGLPNVNVGSPESGKYDSEHYKKLYEDNQRQIEDILKELHINVDITDKTTKGVDANAYTDPVEYHGGLM